jgi:NDP-sugar pyrophosphorylase family protein
MEVRTAAVGAATYACLLDSPEIRMKVVILAGGLGTRISEETALKPKPMVEIGGRPVLWHIMKIYSTFGFRDFITCLGYKGYLIKEFFANYFLHMEASSGSGSFQAASQK